MSWRLPVHRRVSQRARPQRRIGYTSAPPGARSSTTHSTLPCVTIFFTPRVCPPCPRAPPMVEGGGELQGPGTPARPMRCRVLAPAAPNTSQAPPSPAMGGWGLVRSRAPPAPRGTYLGRPQCSTSAPIIRHGQKKPGRGAPPMTVEREGPGGALSGKRLTPGASCVWVGVGTRPPQAAEATCSMCVQRPPRDKGQHCMPPTAAGPHIGWQYRRS